VGHRACSLTLTFEPRAAPVIESSSKFSRERDSSVVFPSLPVSVLNVTTPANPHLSARDGAGRPALGVRKEPHRRDGDAIR